MFKKDQGKQIVQQHIQSQNIVKRYTKGNLLGKGGFAKCYQFISQQTNRKYAAKIIQKSSLTKPKAKQKLQSQIKIHKSLHHHHIVKFQHFFQDQQYVYILLQICRPQTLNDLLKRRKRITEFETKYYVYQITQALKYIHQKKVIHRDLKLGNLFLTDQLHIKVGDFGLATKLNFDNERRKTTCGTPNYLAPQILINKNGHSYEVDVWSIGIISYALLFGRPPFQTNDLKLTYSKIKSCNYSFPDTVDVSTNAKKFITKILQLQPHKRPTLDQILQDQFISSIQIPKGLPLATISIPPSMNLIKKYEKNLNGSTNNESCMKSSADESMNSMGYRTLDKNKIMMSTDKLETCQKKDNLLKKDNSKQNILMQRAASTAGLLQRKKVSTSFREGWMNKQVTKQQIPMRVIFYQQNPKFGISYMLSTGAFGMRYNDSTCIVTNHLLSQLKYLTTESNLKQLSAQVYPFHETPQALNKKVKIINHYIKQLKKKKIQTEQKIANQLRIQLQKMRAKQTSENCMKVYVVRSLKTSKAQFFQFNNGFVQVIFQDSSQVIFLNPNIQQIPNNKNNIATFITKFSQLKQFDFTLLDKQSEDIKKRINYALSVIGKVKKSFEFKQTCAKQNKQPLQQSIDKHQEKERSLLSRSSSTTKLMMRSNQSSMTNLNGKDMNLTSKYSKLQSTSQNKVYNPLRQLSNRMY